jgi:hypothetical protein
MDCAARIDEGHATLLASCAAKGHDDARTISCLAVDLRSRHDSCAAIIP